MKSGAKLSWFVQFLLLAISPWTPVAGGEAATAEDKNAIGGSVGNTSTTKSDDTQRQKKRPRVYTSQYSQCLDLREDCPKWAAEGACQSHLRYMGPHCPQSCNTCYLMQPRKVPIEETFSVAPPQWLGPLQWDFPTAMGADLGLPQIVRNFHQEEAMLMRVQQARLYMESIVMQQDRYATVRESCRNLSEDCTTWALQNQCQDNPGFMLLHCAPVCFSCEQLDVRARCPVDPNEKMVWYHGDANGMFERIAQDASDPRGGKVTVLSRPIDHGDQLKHGDPWIIQIDGFLSHKEAQHLIHLGKHVGYVRTADSEMSQLKVGESDTSYSAWCQSLDCKVDTGYIQLLSKLERLTQIPSNHSDSLQMLFYPTMAFHDERHDFLNEEATYRQGVRIVTAFLFLNDKGLEGGEIHFSALDLTIPPRTGRLLLWSNVPSETPNQPHSKVFYKALPVRRGAKYGATLGMHQRAILDEC